MGHYQSASILFEQMRVLSLATADGALLDGMNLQSVPPTPPHILALGPENSGKTTLCKTLINYAVRGEPSGRDEWSPILVNVDPGDVRHLGLNHLELHLMDLSFSRAPGLSQEAFPPHPCPPRYLPQQPLVHWDYQRPPRRRFGPQMH
jgi:hypothetical protein